MDRFLRSVRQPSRRGALLGAPAHVLEVAALAALLISFAACTERDVVVPLAHTFDSPQQLATAVVQALELQDAARLESLALSEEEFRAHVWPRLPVSRPERGVPFGFVWSQLQQRSRAYLQSALAEHGGLKLDVVNVRFRGERTDYGAFVVSRDAEITVIDERDQQWTVRLFGSILEQNGRYKLFSYVVD